MGAPVIPLNGTTIPVLKTAALCFLRHQPRSPAHSALTSALQSIRRAVGWHSQLREAFPFKHGQQYLIFDHDTKFGTEVKSAIANVGLTAMRTSIRSPWQNGVAERWVGSCRRALLDHIIPLNERHLKRLLFHGDRTHLGLATITVVGASIREIYI